MAGSAVKVIWLIVTLSIKEGFTQEQINSNKLPDSSYYYREYTNGDDAIEMGRSAAEDMGALMASPPVKLLHLNQDGEGSISDRRQFPSQSNIIPLISQPSNIYSMNDFTQEQVPTNHIRPLVASNYNSEITNGNDAIVIGRSADGNMGGSMLSPLFMLNHLNEGESINDRHQLLSQNNIIPLTSQSRNSDNMNEPQYVCFQYLADPTVEGRGRSAGRSVNPLSLPLVPMLPSTTPLGSLPLLPPLALPIIQALLPPVGLRRRRLLLPPRLPLIPPPPALRPLRLPRLGRTLGRSSFSPY